MAIKVCIICGDEFESVESEQVICLFCTTVHESMPTHKVSASLQISDFDRTEVCWLGYRNKFIEDKILDTLAEGGYDPTLLKVCYVCGHKFYAFNPKNTTCENCYTCFPGEGYVITKLPNCFCSHKKHRSPVFKDKPCLTCGNFFTPVHGSDKCCEKCKPSKEVREEKQKAKNQRWSERYKIKLANAKRGIYPDPPSYVAYSSIKSTAPV